MVTAGGTLCGLGPVVSRITRLRLREVSLSCRRDAAHGTRQPGDELPCCGTGFPREVRTSLDRPAVPPGYGAAPSASVLGGWTARPASGVAVQWRRRHVENGCPFP